MSAPTGSRMALRRQRRRSRLRLLVLALAVPVLLTVAVTVFLAVTRTTPPEIARTVLLQVQAANGAGLSNVLVADTSARPDGGAALVALPPELDVDGLPLSEALTMLPPEQLRAAVGDVLGVKVDAGWVLDTPTALALVDAVGGLELDVDTAVVRGGRPVLNPGPQQLDGLRAFAYATYLAPGEDESARLDRLNQVVGALVAALPEQVQPVLEELGARSVSNLTARELAGFLEAVRAAAQEDQLRTGTGTAAVPRVVGTPAS